MIGSRLASGDCERIHDGLFAQPVNSASSLAYVVAGAALFARARRSSLDERGRLIAFVLATAANGVGGLAYHGPGGALSRALHDAALLATLGLVLVTDAERLAALRRPGPSPTGGPVAIPVAVASGAAVVALSPQLSSPAQVVLAVGAIGAVAAHRITRWRRGAADAARTHGGRLVATGAVAAGAYLTSRSGGPLCAPESVFQGHAAWHVLTAAMLFWWGESAFTNA